MSPDDGAFPENVEALIDQPLASLPDGMASIESAVEELWPNVLENGKIGIKWSRCKNENGWTETCHITNGLGEKREFDESSVSEAIARPWAQENSVCPRMFELWVRLDVLNEERARKQEQNYNSETDRIEDLRRVDEAIKKVIEALNADSTSTEKTDSSEAYRRHQQKAARAKAEKQRPRIRANRKHMLDVWLSGNYTTRDICAEQEAEALGITFSTAREYLRNSPNPDPWPARDLN